MMLKRGNESKNKTSKHMAKSKREKEKNAALSKTLSTSAQQDLFFFQVFGSDEKKRLTRTMKGVHWDSNSRTIQCKYGNDEAEIIIK